MSADNRTAHTDAVATLGTIIDMTQKRDAIHLATEPVFAAEKLFPGQDIGLVNGQASTKATKLLGIVDPFLKAPVFPGERFWLIVYPRQINTLRHIWEHPDFPELPATDPVAAVQETAVTAKQIATKWLEDYAESAGVSYSRLMTYLEDNEGHDEIYIGGGVSYIYPDYELWDNYNEVTGKSVEAHSYDDGCRGC